MARAADPVTPHAFSGDLSLGMSLLLLMAGLMTPLGFPLTPWLTYPVLVLPMFFFMLNGLVSGTLFSLLFLCLFYFEVSFLLPYSSSGVYTVELRLISAMILVNIPAACLQQRYRNRGNRHLARLLYSDQLTGLPNRNQLIKDVQHIRTPILFLINIDDFKEINDVFSPKAGDTILRELAELIQSVIRDLPCSYYKLTADEFALLFENTGDFSTRQQLSILAETLSSRIAAQEFSIDESEIRLRVSIGIGDSRINENDNVLAQADMALKTAKKIHKPYLFFTQTIDTRENYHKNIHSLKVLTEALEHNRIVPYYMAIINSNTGQPESYECLARLIDPDGVVYPPHFFLEISKKARLYSLITRMVFRKAADYFNDLPYQFTVNISMDDMDDPETVSTILEILETHPKLHNRVIFEILESESINNYPQVMIFIQLVKTYGCKIAIDDFGSGYSNFENVSRLRVDYLKINGALVRNIVRSPQNRFIVENIHNFAAGLGIKTVAEYVEDESILQHLKHMKIDYLQGYYFGAPAEDILPVSEDRLLQTLK
ncbi:bifunctional diguanylate cyclase/phosphodiesterase [Marispirochaeta aestuarii]|uniref:bifunctional diguanylate cyclase/phosphodiesterase n=1 Tax=Marispirochaeta aestuarii TaxID=1963862 RepID=UPI0029C99729|nr:bifunctional diguanylate cyclase/phosphodiesterase [Marispirochaeta aestuarii]